MSADTYKTIRTQCHCGVVTFSLTIDPAALPHGWLVELASAAMRLHFEASPSCLVRVVAEDAGRASQNPPEPADENVGDFGPPGLPTRLLS